MQRVGRDEAPAISSRNVLLAFAVKPVPVAPAHADVRPRTVSTGHSGFADVADVTTGRTVAIAGDRSRSDDDCTRPAVS